MRRTLAALSVLGLLLAGCTSPESEREPASDGSPTPPADVTAAAVPPAPKAGACYRLTLAEATRATNEDTPVPCRSAHTARTVHVGRLNLVVNGHLLAVDSARARSQLATTCPRRLAAYLGGDAQDRALSRFQVVWFSPTLDQAAQGARWFRCDVVVFGRGGRLMALPRRGSLQGVLDRDGLARFGLCGTARPGNPGFERVACGLRHSWVAISTIPLEGGRRYPGAARVRQAGDAACADQVRERAGFPLEFTYGWEWPTRRQWDSGQRFGFCWAPA